MSIISVLKEALGIKGAAVKDISWSSAGNLMVSVKIMKKHRCRCGICGKRCRHFDNGRREARMWRAMDLGGMQVFIIAELERVECPKHGVVTCHVPWAEHNSRFTRDFEMRVAWLAKAAAKTVVSALMRINWSTVGNIVTRVMEKLDPNPTAKFNNLRKIGVDETSYKKGHKYITIVVNQETNQVIWIHEGYGKEVFAKFLEMLTPEQRASIIYVSGDGALWIQECIDIYLPNARRCIDPFHVVSWVTEVVDTIRKGEWNRLKHTEFSKVADIVKGSKYSLVKNPENLTPRQEARLIEVFQTSPKLEQAHQLKEMLREVFKRDSVTGWLILNRWIARAKDSLIDEFKELANKIERHKAAIKETLRSGLSNARIESANNRIKVIMRRSFGFRNLQNMFDLIMLCCGGTKINLPWEVQL